MILECAYNFNASMLALSACAFNGITFNNRTAVRVVLRELTAKAALGESTNRITLVNRTFMQDTR